MVEIKTFKNYDEFCSFLNRERELFPIHWHILFVFFNAIYDMCTKHITLNHNFYPSEVEISKGFTICISFQFNEVKDKPRLIWSAAQPDTLVFVNKNKSEYIDLDTIGSKFVFEVILHKHQGK